MKHKHKMDHSHFLVSPEKKVRLKDYPTDFTGDFRNKHEAAAALEEDKIALSEAQELLYADARYSCLLVFQAMDAAGKDGTIKHVMSGVNPQGCSVHSFKAPSSEDQSYPFLRRYMLRLPRKGRIGIFNRSYYEEVLATRVHNEFLDAQRLPDKKYDKDFWKQRFEDICAFEKHLASTGMVILKFFLNVSPDEQKKRFMERLENPEKHWKFSAADLKERGYWDDYMSAYEDLLAATSTEHAPWYVIPADKKWFSRAAVADIIIRHFEKLDLAFPKVTKEQMARIADAKEALQQE